MSMMDVMNSGGMTPPSNDPQQPQPQQPQVGQGQPTMRMGEQPEQMQEVFNKVMTLASEEIWEGSAADQVADRLRQDDSEPAQVVGTFTGMLLMMATTAARSKGGMLPPIIVIAAAGQIASQLTDIALMTGAVTPDNADDTADAGALIGIEALLMNNGAQMEADELQEFKDITKAIIDASPQAMATAADVGEEAIEDIGELGALEDDVEDDEDSPDGMAAAMGGM